MTSSATSGSEFIANATTTALWIDQLGHISNRPALDGDTNVDVAIVGGGFSGLWTAYYLAKADPSIRILVIERDFCGFGASGRNGGWAEGGLASAPEKYASWSSLEAAQLQAAAVADAVDEIGRVAHEEDIECGYVKGGWIRVARNAAQEERMRDEMAAPGAHGTLLGAGAAREWLNATSVRAGIYSSDCAALDPARLVRGLAEACERLGVVIVEGTAVREIDGRRVHTSHGTVTADSVVRATEAYTRDLKGEKRKLLPVYSLMVATEPLSDEMFDEIGLGGRPTFSDDRFMVIYGQRTQDNRLAFGGRGVPYLFGSAITRSGEIHDGSHALLRETLIEMLPIIRDVSFTHRWGGVLGIPRDWVPSLHFDHTSGTGVLGGYVGEGVAAANLAGRTMADLIREENTERSTYPWVGHQARSWEPEPFRWLGVRSSRSILHTADEREYRTDKQARIAYQISKFLKGA